MAGENSLRKGNITEKYGPDEGMKNTQEQLRGERQSTWKRIQSNHSKDDSRTQ